MDAHHARRGRTGMIFMKTKHILKIAGAFAFAACIAFGAEPSPRLFRTTADIGRAKTQIVQYPEMAAARDAIAAKVQEYARAWKRLHRDAGKRDTNAWLAAGAKSKRPPLPDVLDTATLYSVA